jgi:hypothetical protein
MYNESSDSQERTVIDLRVGIYGRVSTQDKDQRPLSHGGYGVIVIFADLGLKERTDDECAVEPEGQKDS